MSGEEVSVDAATTATPSEGVLAVDLAGEVIYVNRTAELIAGGARRELLAHSLRYLFETIDGVLPSAANRRAARNDRWVKASRAWILDQRDRLWILIEFSAEPIHDRDGRIAGAIIVFREVAKPMEVPCRFS